MKLFDRLAAIDRRIIYLSVGLVVAIPLILKFKMPIRVSQEVRSAYETVENLPSGSVVLASIDYDATSAPELTPMFRSFLRQCFRNELKVIYTGHLAIGLPLAQFDLDMITEECNAVYGEDYINLGYRPGFVAVMIGFGREIRDFFAVDYKGVPIDSFPMMKNVHNYNDIALIVDFGHGITPDYWVQYVVSRFGVKMFACATGVMAPSLYPYLQAGQITGLIGGLQGAAEYETLVGNPETGTFGMPAQSIAHILIIVFIIFGNIGYFISRRKK
ncbi:hypothetical protein AMJ74_02485 [candidate division WOR_3 bacterium SM1_77]|uniref:Uncharacterized protein n=1 Tax=candidate division WOR_3 bacterium SM1_77 TaxID=1703778 RepID=A0A0S8K0I7_UNCW3|nr:MAG: hypothetical protein AMJ74_02485 [candidate division WOR_3 bacterium SM1_77]